MCSTFEFIVILTLQTATHPVRQTLAHERTPFLAGNRPVHTALD